MSINLLLKAFVVVFFISCNISEASKASKATVKECCDADCLEWKARIRFTH